MAWNVDEMVQRGHNFAIVDEVDSILIDEARTPLIISGPADQSPKWYADFAKLVKRLHKDEDYEVDIRSAPSVSSILVWSRSRTGSASRTSTRRSTPHWSDSSTTRFARRNCSSATRICRPER